MLENEKQTTLVLSELPSRKAVFGKYIARFDFDGQKNVLTLDRNPDAPPEIGDTMPEGHPHAGQMYGGISEHTHKEFYVGKDVGKVGIAEVLKFEKEPQPDGARVPHLKEMYRLALDIKFGGNQKLRDRFANASEPHWSCDRNFFPGYMCGINMKTAGDTMLWMDSQNDLFLVYD